MNGAYNELVGILATFSTPFRSYRIDYVYRDKDGDNWGDVMTQYGMDYVLLTSAKSVENGLSDAFASAIHHIWKASTKAYTQTFYQLVGLQTPEALLLPGDWKHWAEK